MHHHTPNAGFSLLELLCACWILAILSLIAYPSYQHIMTRSQQQSVQQALLHKASTLWEKHLTTHDSLLNIAQHQSWPQPLLNGRYQLNIDHNAQGQLIIKAEAMGGQVRRDTCSPWALSESMVITSRCHPTQ